MRETDWTKILGWPLIFFYQETDSILLHWETALVASTNIENSAGANESRHVYQQLQAELRDSFVSDSLPACASSTKPRLNLQRRCVDPNPKRSAELSMQVGKARNQMELRVEEVRARHSVERGSGMVAMFLDFFGLQAQPFGVTPDPSFLYLSI